MGDLSERMSEQTSYGTDSYKGETPLGTVRKPMPDIQTMRLCVAKMLPEHIKIIDGWGLQIGKSFFFWIDKDRSSEVTDREWLHVAWLVLQTLEPDEGKRVVWELNQICGSRVDKYNPTAGFPLVRIAMILRLQVDAVLKAICRVKHPEMFTK